MQYLSFWIWITSCNVIFPRSSNLPTNIIILFFPHSKIVYSGCMPQFYDPVVNWRMSPFSSCVNSLGDDWGSISGIRYWVTDYVWSNAVGLCVTNYLAFGGFSELILGVAGQFWIAPTVVESTFPQIILSICCHLFCLSLLSWWWRFNQ